MKDNGRIIDIRVSEVFHTVAKQPIKDSSYLGRNMEKDFASTKMAKHTNKYGKMVLEKVLMVRPK